MNSNRIIIVIVVLLLGVGAFFLGRNSCQQPVPPDKAQVAVPAQPQSTAKLEVPKPQPPPEPEKPYAPPLVRDPKLASLVDRNAPENKRVPADIAFKLPAVANPEDIQVLLSVLADPKDTDTVRNEVINLLRRSKAPGLLDALCNVMDNPSEQPRFRSFAMQHIGLIAEGLPDSEAKKKAIAKMQAAIDDKDVAVCRQALQNLCRIKDPKGTEAAVKWLNDESKDMDALRDIAIRCVKDLDLKDQIPNVRKYVRDSNEVIRIAATVVLSEWGDEESRPAIREAAVSKDRNSGDTPLIS
jgi:HEAT repeat protein